MTEESLKRYGYKLTEEYDPETLAKPERVSRSTFYRKVKSLFYR
jgi:hypothetical protein